jgi:nitrite reductase/ring-hydroxylating ferredoxin subunit
MANTCAHLGGPLNEGTLEDGSVVCPWHGSRYALEDGSVLDGPSAHPQISYDTRVSETGMIEVRTRE